MFTRNGEILIMHLTSEGFLKWLLDKPFKYWSQCLSDCVAAFKKKKKALASRHDDSKR